MPLTHEEAQRAIAATHAKAAELGIAVTAAVVDEGGHLVALGRMDKAFPLSPQIAEAKACSSASLNREGDSLLALSRERPDFFAVIAQMSRVPLIPGIGSKLLRREGRVLGALGVSGGKPEQDVECADAALRALGL